MRNLSSPIRILALIATIISLTSCGTLQYYKYSVADVHKDQTAKIEVSKAIISGSCIVIHADTAKWILSHPRLVNDTLVGVKSKFWNSYKFPYTNIQGKNTAYVDQSYAPYIDQTHLLTRSFQTKDSLTYITMPDISQIDIILPTGSIKNNKDSDHLGRNILIGCGSAVAVVAVVVLVACNCPYVYTGTDQTPLFQGNLYTGAIYPGLERSDYLPLNKIPIGKNEIQFNIKNKRNEQIFTNQLQLVKVDHPENCKVLFDQKGEVHTIGQLETPLFARTNSGKDIKDLIEQKDNSIFGFDDEAGKDALSSITLTFKKQELVDHAKLVLNVKNTEWEAYIYNNVCSLFGDQYKDWSEKQSKKDPETIIKNSIAQGFIMSVYIKTKTGWKFIDHINAVGSLAFRDVVLPIDLKECEGSEVQVMLKAGFKFWDLDYAAIDLSKDEQVKVNFISPIAALDSLGNDHSLELSKDDANYMEHYKLNDEVIVKFSNVNFDDEKTQTLFLQGKGFYRRMDNYEGKMQVNELRKLKGAGAISVYSKKKFLEVKNGLTVSIK